MKIKTLTVTGLECAMHAMRNPLNSWAKGDSDQSAVGPNDRDLSLRLQKAGPEHAKHLRMVNVYVDITAPRYWLIEMDTYRAGVEKISCSTMHTLTKHPFTEDDFEFDDTPVSKNMVRGIVHTMNTLRTMYLDEADPEKRKEVWRALIQNLPHSFLQTRTYMISYAALRNIVRQREGHKLREWKQFIDWCHTLPEAWMIFDEFEEAAE